MHHVKIAPPATERRRIGSGSGRPGAPVTLADVAAAAGVSQMTVSRVVNGGPASAQARREVLRAVDRLGYMPNQAARALASKRRSRRSPAKDERSASPVKLQDFWTPFGKFIL